MSTYNALHSGDLYMPLWELTAVGKFNLIFEGIGMSADLSNAYDLMHSIGGRGSIPEFIEGSAKGFTGNGEYISRSFPVFYANSREAMVWCVGRTAEVNGKTRPVILVYEYDDVNLWRRYTSYSLAITDMDNEAAYPNKFMFGYVLELVNRGYGSGATMWTRGDTVLEKSVLASHAKYPNVPSSIKEHFPSFEFYVYDSENPPVPPEPPDPYSPGGNSGAGGGTGNFNNESDKIGFSGVPDYNITGSGFVTAYAPSVTQLNELAEFMWNDLNLDNWRKLFANPMDVITSLMMLPVTPDKGATKDVKVGNAFTGVLMTTLASQVTTVDCGTLLVDEYWGSYLDYDPYTKIQIYLPYIGFRPIIADQIMGKTIHVQYFVDCLSGQCVAQILCGEDLLYSFPGTMGYQIPFSAADWNNFLSGCVALTGAAIATVATSGSSAPLTVPAMAASVVNMVKQNVDHSGTLSGNAGFLSENYVYLAITRPKQALPADQNKFLGYPALMTANLSVLEGFTRIKDIHLENMPCTSEEKTEIENLLKGGVIF